MEKRKINKYNPAIFFFFSCGLRYRDAYLLRARINTTVASVSFFFFFFFCTIAFIEREHAITRTVPISLRRTIEIYIYIHIHVYIYMRMYTLGEKSTKPDYLPECGASPAPYRAAAGRYPAAIRMIKLKIRLCSSALGLRLLCFEPWMEEKNDRMMAIRVRNYFSVDYPPVRFYFSCRQEFSSVQKNKIR